jgi:hypothetical protein
MADNIVALTLDYPHDVAVIFRNPSNTSITIPGLSKKGITFRPYEIIAVIGNPLLFPANPQRYDGMDDVHELHRMIADGVLEVLSTPTNKNTAVQVGPDVPNTRILIR